jgi:hypothetical protein
MTTTKVAMDELPTTKIFTIFRLLAFLLNHEDLVHRHLLTVLGCAPLQPVTFVKG